MESQIKTKDKKINLLSIKEQSGKQLFAKNSDKFCNKKKTGWTSPSSNLESSIATKPLVLHPKWSLSENRKNFTKSHCCKVFLEYSPF